MGRLNTGRGASTGIHTSGPICEGGGRELAFPPVTQAELCVHHLVCPPGQPITVVRARKNTDASLVSAKSRKADSSRKGVLLLVLWAGVGPGRWGGSPRVRESQIP